MTNTVNLSKFNNSSYNTGRSNIIRAIWFFTNALFLKNAFNPLSRLKIAVLRLFGAKIGIGVVLKPGINVKYPWNLEIGNFTWVGENVWIDSLAPIKIGNHVCISQGAFLCTGNHDWSDPAFSLIVNPIIIEDGAWIGANSLVLAGVTMASHSIVAAGAVLTKNTESYLIYAGNPAIAIKKRVIEGRRF